MKSYLKKLCQMVQLTVGAASFLWKKQANRSMDTI
jgi:hypothetical protein